ncbi:hypothetical protein RMATCC62417_04608 [Rhizopus microsporus]|nr:hypothetical protein RMATCC62417_04608 [Rhizopus microsporus]
MYRVFIIVLFFILQSVFAGPGTHHYAKPDHSNYGDYQSTREHIQEHFKGILKDDLPNLNETNIQYYLFVLHDSNGDGYLDGHELRATYTDFDVKHFNIPLSDIVEMIDHTLEEDDLNGDGLVSWAEYLESQAYHV